MASASCIKNFNKSGAFQVRDRIVQILFHLPECISIIYFRTGFYVTSFVSITYCIAGYLQQAAQSEAQQASISYINMKGQYDHVCNLLLDLSREKEYWSRTVSIPRYSSLIGTQVSDVTRRKSFGIRTEMPYVAIAVEVFRISTLSLTISIV